MWCADHFDAFMSETKIMVNILGALGDRNLLVYFIGYILSTNTLSYKGHHKFQKTVL